MKLEEELFRTREGLYEIKYSGEYLRVEKTQLQNQIETPKSANETLCEEIIGWKLKKQGSHEST